MSNGISSRKRVQAEKAESMRRMTIEKKEANSTGELVFLNVAIEKRSRAGLNKLVDVMGASNQRQVIEQLVAEELRRRNLRLPRSS